MEKTNRLRGYFIRAEKDAEYGIAVVAKSAKSAKIIAIHSGDMSDYDEFIDVTVSWIRDADVKGLVEGVVEAGVDALKRNLYGYLEDVECPNCGHTVSHLENDESIVLCEDCKEKLKEVSCGGNSSTG